MKVGILLPQTGELAKSENVLYIGKEAEKEGLDSLETLTYLAGNTERISLGTSIIDIFFHNPVTLARRFATLDVLSGGRVIAGLELDGQKMSMTFLAYPTDAEEQGQTNICNC